MNHPIRDRTAGFTTALALACFGLAPGFSAPALAVAEANAAIVGVFAGHGSAFAVTAAGQAYAWGANSEGQLGIGSTATQNQPVLIPNLTGIAQMASGPHHTLAVTAAGDVYAWGSNDIGQLGLGTTVASPSPRRVPGLAKVTQVAVGDSSSFALTADGAVYAWGAGGTGRLGTGSSVDRAAPTRLAGIAPVAQISTSNLHSLAVTRTGQVYAWGLGMNGRLGSGEDDNSRAPQLVPGLTGITRVAAGASSSYAVDSSGAVYAWGGNDRGQLGLGTASATDRWTPAKLTLPAAADVVAGVNHAAARTRTGQVFAWGANDRGQAGSGTVGATPQWAPLAVALPATARQIAAGDLHTLALAADGQVYGWGANALGALFAPACGGSGSEEDTDEDDEDYDEDDEDEGDGASGACATDKAQPVALMKPRPPAQTLICMRASADEDDEAAEECDYEDDDEGTCQPEHRVLFGKGARGAKPTILVV
ncbi:MAG: hypothetical protein LBT54_06220, partial [Bifidobacteriaceae bacterium]|nr:hypothetical protein [Bifidobacteriaceae bacterium]